MSPGRASRAAALALGCSGALAAGGCAEDLAKVSEIERMRLLGLATHVGDPASDSSTPAPGETVFAELFVAFPPGRTADELSVSWFACASVSLAVGISACDQSTTSLLGQNGPPTGSFVVPTAIGDAGEPPEGMVLLGVACDGGTFDLAAYLTELADAAAGGAVRSLPQPRCTGGARDQESFTTTIPVTCPRSDPDAQPVGCERNAPNVRPHPLEVTFEGTPWPPGEVREVDAEELHDEPYVLGVSTTSDAFEPYEFVPALGEGTEQRTEEVLVAFAADSGELEVPYRVLSTESTEDTVEWTPPLEADVPAGRVVSVYLVTRDDRGGSRLEERQLRVRGPGPAP